jgi:hypothetical protein
LYSSVLYGLGFLPFLGFTGMLGSIPMDSKPLLMWVPCRMLRPRRAAQASHPILLEALQSS